MNSNANERLLSRHVSIVPRVDKSKYVESYIRGQVAHAGTYASEGRALVLSWNRGDSHEGKIEERTQVHPTSKICGADYGLETPILKPRNMRHPTKSVEPPLAKGTADIMDSDVSKHRTQDHRHEDTSVVMVDKASPRKCKRKASGRQKYSSECDIQDEHLKRLKERRDRKRAKKAIVKQGTDDDDAPESRSRKKPPKKSKGQADGKAKVPAALALMHGFLTTNVGKGRITVKPSLNIGVFNKGRASANTQVVKPSKLGGQNTGFIEDEFLKGAQKQNTTQRKRSSSLPDISIRSTSEKSYNGIDNGKSASLRNSRKSDFGGQKGSSVRKRKSKKSRERSVSLTCSEPQADSIVWDIEFDDVSLRSKLPASLDGQRNQTVLLNNHHLWWASQSGTQDAGDAGVQEQASRESLGGLMSSRHLVSPSPSIGPSESASQLRLSAPDLVSGVQSKYFTCPKSPSLGKFKIISPSTTSRKSVQMSGVGNAGCNNSQKASLNRGPSTISFGPFMNEESEHAQFTRKSSDLEFLPHVDPQDYQYSDNELCLRPLGQTGWQTQVTANKEENYSCIHTIGSWQGYESRGQPYTLTAVDDQLMDVSSDDCYNPFERDEDRCYGTRSATFYDPDICPGDLFETIDGPDNYPVSSIPDSESSIDEKASPTRFAQGRALLLGYAGGNLWASSDLSRKPQMLLSQAEADVVGGLKNHWLPQRL